MRKTSLVAVLVAVAMLAAGLVYAETEQGAKPGEGQKGKQWQEQKEKIAKDLNLTPEQQQKLEVNRKAQRETMNRLHKELKEKQDKLQELLKDYNLTKAAVDPLVSQIKSVQDQLVDARVEAIFAVKAILTPEQFAKLQQRSEKRQEDKKERKDNWREKKKECKPGANQGQE